MIMATIFIAAEDISLFVPLVRWHVWHVRVRFLVNESWTYERYSKIYCKYASLFGDDHLLLYPTYLLLTSKDFTISCYVFLL